MNAGAGPRTEAVLPGLREFRDALNTVFQVQVDTERCVEMTLVTIDERAAPPGWESFSLLFAGPDDPFPQATYPLRHPDLGAFALFVVPILSDVGGPRFEAVFNRSP